MVAREDYPERHEEPLIETDKYEIGIDEGSYKGWQKAVYVRFEDAKNAEELWKDAQSVEIFGFSLPVTRGANIGWNKPENRVSFRSYDEDFYLEPGELQNIVEKFLEGESVGDELT